MDLIKIETKPPLTREQTVRAMAQAVYDERIKRWEKAVDERQALVAARDKAAVKVAKRHANWSEARVYSEKDGVIVRVDVHVTDLSLPGDVAGSLRSFSMPPKPDLGHITNEIRQKVHSSADRVKEILQSDQLRKALAEAGEKFLAKGLS